MILKWLAVKTVPIGTHVQLNDLGKRVFKDKVWGQTNYKGVIRKISKDGNIASIDFPAIIYKTIKIHRRYLNKV